MSPDGFLITLADYPPAGRRRRLIHVNGITSTVEKQQRDLRALARLTTSHPLDILGVHNQTSGFHADVLESLLGKAELYRFWPELQQVSGSSTSASAYGSLEQRRREYAELVQRLSVLDLEPETDMLAVAQTLQRSPQDQPLSDQASSNLDALLKLPFVQRMGWSEFSQYFYGSYPAGAPRPTLRLAYEILRSLQLGADIFLVAHSQGLIIAALACQIVREMLLPQTKWMETLRIIGYGPVILFEDLPLELRSQTILIQHRQDLVAESLSNVRNVGLWSHIQTQFKNLLDNADGLIQTIGNDSYHTASHYLGLRDEPTSARSAQLIQLLLTQDWQASPALAALRGSRIILEA
ncbi:hypothetical protein L3556_05890 [Candidatus Synechococcus calcipolaris G9]|uniref:Alpha/beta hydrolase n=1 Tax=Candidatus Synechococcus calcipolaris G9 TaxID=1497997 RepID=A0ABT6EXD1_9SYNE|nr:hypothetical protein [Candidatus Synechococcus calcipolaris]MDG2990465.1 hypothetical protein [Candidatus Synechococcus calcipolaris G9]